LAAAVRFDDEELDDARLRVDDPLLLADDDRLLLADALLLLADERLDPPDFFDPPRELPLLRRSAISRSSPDSRQLVMGLSPETGTISPHKWR
jgi:hypothetical protein